MSITVRDTVSHLNERQVILFLLQNESRSHPFQIMVGTTFPNPEGFEPKESTLDLEDVNVVDGPDET